jgi:hypothetical protein
MKVWKLIGGSLTSMAVSAFCGSAAVHAAPPQHHPGGGGWNGGGGQHHPGGGGWNNGGNWNGNHYPHGNGGGWNNGGGGGWNNGGGGGGYWQNGAYYNSNYAPPQTPYVAAPAVMRYQIPAQYAGTPSGYTIPWGGANYLTNDDGTMSPY